MTISSTATDFFISSPEGVQGCIAENATTARCPRYGPAISLFLAGGDDRVTLEPTRVRAGVQAGVGSDVLNGSEAPNYFSGEEGDDLIRGRGGNDRLDGGKGVDRLLGGAGDDYIRANDGRRDDRIDCGAGPDDLALIDKRDPKPIHCEQVQVK